MTVLLTILQGAALVIFSGILALGSWFAIIALIGALNAQWPWRKDSGAIPKGDGSLVVLIPAHNEESGLLGTLESIKADLNSEDRILVIADNCSDSTADIARTSGVEVVERFDNTLRGKGFALAFGRDHLAPNPPDMVLVVDADCRLESGSIPGLKAHVAQTGKPGQALYLLETPHEGEAGFGVRLNAFAIRVKNLVRARGLASLRLPVQLSGSGMIFPYADFERLELSTGQLAEDLYFGLLLAREGQGAKFVETAFVRSVLPTAASAERSQRTRWIHGHIQVMFELAPKAFIQSLLRGNIGGALLAFDAMVPPLIPLLFSLGILTSLALGLALGTGSLPLSAGLAGLCVLAGLALSLLVAWYRVGRDIIAFNEILGLLLVVPNRLATTFKAVLKPERKWVRTARSDEDD